MSASAYRFALLAVALVFSAIFFYVVVPPLIENPDIIGAFAAGFVNPYASGYAADTLSCWAVLAIWVLYERKQVPNGWIALVLGVVPGVAVGLVAYLLMRQGKVA